MIEHIFMTDLKWQIHNRRSAGFKSISCDIERWCMLWFGLCNLS